MNSTAEKFTSVIVSLLVVAIVTSFVLPGRDTPKVINSFFTGLSKAVTAAIGVEPKNKPKNYPIVQRK